MIRINKLIKKSELFDILKDKQIASIELQRGKNEKIVDPEMCRVLIYYTHEGLNHLVATCLIASEQYEFEGKERAFLRGLGSAKTNQFIRASVVRRIMTLETKYGIYLGVPKIFKDFVNENIAETEW